MNDWIARGEGQVTEAPDSPPCDYCGCKPANAVVWEDENGNKSSVNLCAGCDDWEIRQLELDDTDDPEDFED